MARLEISLDKAGSSPMLGRDDKGFPDDPPDFATPMYTTASGEHAGYCLKK